MDLKREPNAEIGPKDYFEIVSNNNGFTLIDIILTLMIAGILAVIAIPQFSSMTAEAKLNEAAGELSGALEYARSLAVTYQKPFGLEVNGNGFSVYDDGSKTDPDPDYSATPPVGAYGVVFNPLDKQSYVKNFDTLNNYQGVTITSAPAGNKIRFFPDGHCSDPAGSGNTFVINFADFKKTIVVNAVTGWINIQ